jgi:hypothetical protein
MQYSELLNLRYLNLFGNQRDHPKFDIACLNSLKQLKELILTELEIQSTQQLSLPSLHTLYLEMIKVSGKNMERIFQGVAPKLANLTFTEVEITDSSSINVSFTALESFTLDPAENYKEFYDGLISAVCGSAQTLRYLEIDFRNLHYEVDSSILERFENLEKLRYYSMNGVPEVELKKKFLFLCCLR